MKSEMVERARETITGPKGIVGQWDRGRTFLAQVRNEMERVTWPSWKEVQATTLVVIVTCAIFGIYLWGIDLFLSAVTGTIFRTFGAS